MGVNAVFNRRKWQLKTALAGQQKPGQRAVVSNISEIYSRTWLFFAG